MATTKYVVLYKATTEDKYERLPQDVEAAGAVAAVRAAAADTQEGGIYVAIPERSFDPITIEIETNPRVKVVK